MTGGPRTSRRALRFGLDEPAAAARGEATLFLAVAGDDGRRRRMPGSSPSRRRRCSPARPLRTGTAGSSARARQRARGGDAGTDERCSADAAAADDGGTRRAPAAGGAIPPERVVRLGRSRPGADVHGAVVDATAWVEPVAGDELARSVSPFRRRARPLAARLPSLARATRPRAPAVRRRRGDRAHRGGRVACAVAAEHVSTPAAERHRADARGARARRARPRRRRRRRRAAGPAAARQARAGGRARTPIRSSRRGPRARPPRPRAERAASAASASREGTAAVNGWPRRRGSTCAA